MHVHPRHCEPIGLIVHHYIVVVHNQGVVDHMVAAIESTAVYALQRNVKSTLQTKRQKITACHLKSFLVRVV